MSIKDPVGEATLDVMQNAPFYNKWLFSFFRPHLTGSVIELGAGVGTFSEYFSSAGNFTAIDYNKSYVKKLKEKYDAGFGDLEKGQYFFKNKKFDTAVTLNVLEHIEDDNKAFENIFELLNPNGKLCILVPAHQTAYSDIDKNLGHYRRYTRKELEGKLKKAGFEIRYSRYLNFLGLLGWFVSGKIFRKGQLESGQLSLFDMISKPTLFLEKIIASPFGLSVFVVAQKPEIKKDEFKKVSIVVPVFNEQNTVKEIINKIKSSDTLGLNKEIVVVNDGSTDKTEKILKSIKSIKLINHKKNKGKGAAVITGISESSGDLVIIQDADLEYNPNDYPKLLKPILEGKSKVVYGTRLRNLKLKLFGKDKTLHPQNYIANVFLTTFTNLLFSINITDMETCYKVFVRSLLNPNMLYSKSFEIEPEITAIFAKQFQNISEVDIKVKPRSFSEGKKIKPKDGLIAVKTLMIEKFIR